MKKILAIAPYSYLPYFSGGQKFIAKFFEHLSQEVDLTVISVAENDTTQASYRIIPLLKKPFSRYYDRSLVGKITELIQKEKYDTVIWEHPYFSWLAKKIKKRTGIRTIIHTHNIEYQRFKSLGKWWWPILQTYERRCLRRADAVFFITPEDRDFAVSKWRLPMEKTLVVPFGVDINTHPTDKAESKNSVCSAHGIAAGEKILLFNGLLNYKPNLDAVNVILKEVNPLLLEQTSFKYKIIICGKDLPAGMNGLKEYTDKNIIYAGFVDDIGTYFKGADIFLNPVQKGGGVKTKIVEAIAYGDTVISTESGAVGILKEACGDKLITVRDDRWDEFANKILQHANIQTTTPTGYYDHYNWKMIMARVASF